MSEMQLISWRDIEVVTVGTRGGKSGFRWWLLCRNSKSANAIRENLSRVCFSLKANMLFPEVNPTVKNGAYF